MTQTLLSLPAAPVARWTPKRNAAVVSAIRHHAFTDAAARRQSVLFRVVSWRCVRKHTIRRKACFVTIRIKPAQPWPFHK